MVVNLSKPSPPEPLNAALALTMIRGAGRCWGSTKIQKVAFWTELRLLTEGLVGPTFPFIRYTYGPFSIELASTMDFLIGEGFVQPGKPRTLTERGTFVADLCEEGLASVQQNARLLKPMRATLQHCETRTGGELKEEAYALRWKYADQVVSTGDLPEGVQLIEPKKSDFEVPAWLTETLAEEFALSAKEISWAKANEATIMNESLRRLKELARDC